MTQNTFDLVSYYANLLIIQYIGRVRAYATVFAQAAPIIMPQITIETVTFPVVPTSGSTPLTYNGSSTSAINWNDSTATIQAKLQQLALNTILGGDAFTATFAEYILGGDAFTTIFTENIDGGDATGFGLSSILVTGSIASGTLTITFNGVTPPAALLGLGTNTLSGPFGAVVPIITETDLSLPLAVQAAYNLIGPSPAQGKQLDVLGKYTGVSRTGNGFTAQVTLDDSDFLSLIQMAVVRNNSGSSLSDIQALLFQFFPGIVTVTDYQDMFISFEIDSGIGSPELIELFVTEGLLPVPMGVGYDIIIFDSVDPFVFADGVGEGFGDSTDPTVGGELSYVLI